MKVRPKPIMDKPQHAHHWVIDEAHARLSVGRCKLCGTTRVFTTVLAKEEPLPGKGRRPGR